LRSRAKVRVQPEEPFSRSAKMPPQAVRRGSAIRYLLEVTKLIVSHFPRLYAGIRRLNPRLLWQCPFDGTDQNGSNQV